MLGILLAGGRSKRFGRDKLFFRVNGKPLIVHALGRLEAARRIDEVILVASPENAGRLEKLGYRTLVDKLSVGPIGGVYTALELGDAFIAAGDMPLLVPELIDYMVEMFEKSKGIACVPKWENGYLEPLHAAYSKNFREILGRRIKMGSYALNEAIRDSNPCYVPIETLPKEWQMSFFNVNVKGDLSRLGRLRASLPR